jgi:4-hydroxy-tetrahydrodipicolinate synthase
MRSSIEREAYGIGDRSELFFPDLVHHSVVMATMNARDLRGLWIPIVTPFDSAGDVDLDSLERLAANLLVDGVTGLVALGTTGEPATLTPAERRAVVETCDRVCEKASRRLIVGAGTNSTRGTIEEILHLTSGTGAGAALIVVPYYTKPSEAAVVEHYIDVADVSPIPIVAYNVPHRTGRPLGATALLDIGAHPQVIGLKQSVGAIDTDTLEILARASHEFATLAGDDAFITPTILMGASGAIAAAAHVCTPLFSAMTACALSGDRKGAIELATALLPVVTIGFSEPNPAAWKGVLARQCRIATGNLRRPMPSATESTVDRLALAVEHALRLQLGRGTDGCP